ncbi:MAG: Hsp20 family protein [Anaerolineae bacterium]|nr:Hsp20 family protein [Anaerolineae bacterium]
MIEHAARDRDLTPFVDFVGEDLAVAVDVAEHEKHYAVTANLPGVPAEAIEINLDDNVLTISAEVQQEHQAEKGRLLVQERHYGRFSRSVRFPSHVTAEGVEATHKDGLLTLIVPKLANGGAKRISIRNNA